MLIKRRTRSLLSVCVCVCVCPLWYLFPGWGLFLNAGIAALRSPSSHTWQFIFCMISQKSMQSCKDQYQIVLANWWSLDWTPLIMLSWRRRRGLGQSGGLLSKSSCINKITRWCMNEFAAGSAIITHWSAGSQRTGLYQKKWLLMLFWCWWGCSVGNRGVRSLKKVLAFDQIKTHCIINRNRNSALRFDE